MIQNIAIDKLRAHKNNPRQDLGDLTELAESIKARGIMQNLTVVPAEPGYCLSCDLFNFQVGKCQDGHDKNTRPPCSEWQSKGLYTVIIGHRRLAAAKLAGLTEVPCAVVTMTEQEQVATMLLENIQRADLNIYEQARGFQLMLDLGDTVTGIAEKTGFSATTIRHRVKLTELDQNLLAKTMHRNIRFEDYIALEKIIDIKLRNEVLDSIGTSNFNWHLSAAIEREARPERREKLLKFLEGWAQQIKKHPKDPYNYQKCFYGYKIDGYERPNDAEIVGYTFFDSGNDIKLYKEEDKSEIPRNLVLEKAFDDAEDEIKKITRRAYELRKKFVQAFNGGKARTKEVMDFTMVRLLRYGGADPDELLNLLGLDVPADEEEQSWSEKQAKKKRRLMQEYIKRPERTMFIVAWAAIDERQKYYEAQSWNLTIKHLPNDTLDAIYDSLIALGFEMSDDERGLQNGSHKLFGKIAEPPEM